QRRIVGEDDVVAELAIVRDMHVSHDPVVAAQARDATVLYRTKVDGDEFTDRVAVADDQLRRFARVLLVLRRSANGSELEDMVVATDGGVTFDHDMRANTRTGADLYVRADDGIGADLYRRIDLGGRIN